MNIILAKSNHRSQQAPGKFHINMWHDVHQGETLQGHDDDVIVTESGKMAAGMNAHSNGQN